MTDEDVADLVIGRLNAMLRDRDIARDITSLLDQRIGCRAATAGHPTIQVGSVNPDAPTLGPLGLLNGIVGAIPEDGSSKAGWGYITAHYGNDGVIERFSRTDLMP